MFDTPSYEAGLRGASAQPTTRFPEEDAALQASIPDAKTLPELSAAPPQLRVRVRAGSAATG